MNKSNIKKAAIAAILFVIIEAILERKEKSKKLYKSDFPHITFKNLK